jgi:hypothetical protein
MRLTTTTITLLASILLGACDRKPSYDNKFFGDKPTEHVIMHNNTFVGGYTDPNYPVRLQRRFFSMDGALSEAKPGDIIITTSGDFVVVGQTPTPTPEQTVIPTPTP